MPRCRSCQALIVWAHTEKGYLTALDAETVDGEVVAQLPEGANLVAVGQVGSGRNPVMVRYVKPGEGRFVTHLCTCRQD